MTRLLIRARTTACLALLPLLAACTESDTAPARGPTARTTKAIVNWKVGAFSGQDDRGRAITQADLEGNTWVATFFFIKCTGPCPDMVRALKTIHDQSRDLEDLRLVAFTFDPENDTVDALADYAKLWKVDPDRFHFVRLPTKKAVQELQASFKAASPEDFHHTPNFFLINREGVIRRFWDARQDDERGHLMVDLQRLSAGEPLK